MPIVPYSQGKFCWFSADLQNVVKYGVKYDCTQRCSGNPQQVGLIHTHVQLLVSSCAGVTPGINRMDCGMWHRLL